VFLDLCNEDWQAIECSKNGWAVVDDVPVEFVRRDGMLPPPIPERVSSADLFDGSPALATAPGCTN
jgi:hypothetical protein